MNPGVIEQCALLSFKVRPGATAIEFWFQFPQYYQEFLKLAVSKMFNLSQKLPTSKSTRASSYACSVVIIDSVSIGVGIALDPTLEEDHNIRSEYSIKKVLMVILLFTFFFFTLAVPTPHYCSLTVFASFNS